MRAGRVRRDVALFAAACAALVACGRSGGEPSAGGAAPGQTVSVVATPSSPAAAPQPAPTPPVAAPSSAKLPLADVQIGCPPGTTQVRDEPGPGYDKVTFWCEDADGRLEGPRKKYYLTGQIALETPYHRGLPEGRSRVWYEDGKLATEWFDRGGKQNGLSRHWHPNGKLQFEARYVEDRAVGIGRYWNEKGKLIRVRDFAKEPGYVPGE
jgi:MORN repeat protein